MASWLITAAAASAGNSFIFLPASLAGDAAAYAGTAANQAITTERAAGFSLAP